MPSASADIGSSRWSGALPSILGSRLFLRMREAILFPQRYGEVLSMSASGRISVPGGTVQFTPVGRTISTWKARPEEQWISNSMGPGETILLSLRNTNPV